VRSLLRLKLYKNCVDCIEYLVTDLESSKDKWFTRFTTELSRGFLKLPSFELYELMGCAEEFFTKNSEKHFSQKGNNIILAKAFVQQEGIVEIMNSIPGCHGMKIK
jgi:hypothetical protein